MGVCACALRPRTVEWTVNLKAMQASTMGMLGKELAQKQLVWG